MPRSLVRHSLLWRLSLVAAAVLLPAAGALTVTERIADFAAGEAGGAACGDQCTRACPCATLQAALDAAIDGDVVLLVPPANGAPIPCENAVTSKSVVVAAAPWAARPVVLDCDGQGRAVWFDGRARTHMPRVELVDVTVRDGKGDIGGCVRADDVALTVRNCRLERCISTELDTSPDQVAGGGGVAVRFHRNITQAHELRVLVRDTAFSHCHASCNANGGGLEVVFAGDSDGAIIRVEDSSFMHTTTLHQGAEQGNGDMTRRMCGGSGGGATVDFGGRADGTVVSVTRCRFEHTRAAGYGGAVSTSFAGHAAHVAVSISHCTFSDTQAGEDGGALLASVKADSVNVSVSVAHSTFSRARAGAFGGAVNMVFVRDAFAARVSITSCAFAHCQGSIHGGAVGLIFIRDAIHAAVTIARSTFSHTVAGADGGAVEAIVVGDASHAAIAIADSVFRHTHAGGIGGGVYLLAIRGERAEVSMSGCAFFDATAVLRAGAVYTALSRQKAPLPPIYCTTNVQRRSWRASSNFTVDQCSFEHVACTAPTCGGGTLDMGGGVLHFWRSNVTNSSAMADGGFLRTSGSTAVHIAQSRVQGVAASRSVHIHHEGVGALSVRDSWFSEAVQTQGLGAVVMAEAAADTPEFSGSSVLVCNAGEVFVNVSLGASLSIDAWPVDGSTCAAPVPAGDAVAAVRAVDVQWQCVLCPSGTYYLGAGRLQAAGINGGTCTPCPFGATCHGGASVRANAGMWAPAPSEHNATTPSLLPDRLLRCANGYCCRDNTTCLRFDSCAPRRTGLLCGDCEPGTVGVLGSTACRPVQQCGTAVQDILFWPGSVLMTVALIAWQVRAAGAHWQSMHAGTALPASGWSSAKAAAITKSTFAFFQSFPLLVVGDTLLSAYDVVSVAATQVFALQFQAGGNSGVCILGGLTPVEAQGVGLLLVGLALACGFPAVWLGHALLGWFGPAWCKLRPPRASTYAGAMTSIVMLTYSVVAGAVAKLVTCVSVPGHGQQLLIQGSVACWSSEVPWQWVAAAWGLVNSAFVPLALVLAGRQLRRGNIRAHWFWASLVVPLPCVFAWYTYRWWQRHTQARPQQQQQQSSVLAVCEKPAAASHAADTTAAQRERRSSTHTATVGAAALMALEAGYRPDVWWWDAMLLLRRLVLSALPLALHWSPVLQAVAAQVALLLLLVAHVHFKPTISATAHKLEVGYLCCLILVSTLSVRSAALLSASSTDPSVSLSTTLTVLATMLVHGVPAAAILAIITKAAAAVLAASHAGRLGVRAGRERKRESISWQEGIELRIQRRSV